MTHGIVALVKILEERLLPHPNKIIIFLSLHKNKPANECGHNTCIRNTYLFHEPIVRMRMRNK